MSYVVRCADAYCTIRIHEPLTRHGSTGPRRGRPVDHSEHLVVALAYGGLCTFEFGCTVEFFALERPKLGVPWCRFEVCAYERSPIRAAGGTFESRVPRAASPVTSPRNSSARRRYSLALLATI